MKAEDLFKTKSEVASKLDELGIEYPKIKTGANKGNPTLTFKELCDLFDSHSFSIEEVEEKSKPAVVFSEFNSMTFRYS